MACYDEDVHDDVLTDIDDIVAGGHERSLGEFFRLLKAVLEHCVPYDEVYHQINGHQLVTRQVSYVVGVMIVDHVAQSKPVLRVLALDLTFTGALAKATNRL